MNKPTGDMVQVHMLTAYPASLLNRDDAGLAKRIPFGGVSRTRVSSQCLKKHWREAAQLTAVGDAAVRSTRVYERLVAEPLMGRGASEEEAVAIAKWLMSETVDTKPTAKEKGLASAQSSQLLVLTKAETDFLAETATKMLEDLTARGVAITEAALAKEPKLIDRALKESLRALPASIDTALFGRMVTSDLFARVDAAVSVAHAFTTHAEASETDYFTAIDTLKGAEDDAGAGLIQDTELTSGVFYLYVVIDMNQLKTNLVGFDSSVAEQLAANLVEAMATVTPSAKRGSTAPFSYAEFVMTERGSAQPRTLANAFLQPVPTTGAALMPASVGALFSHSGRLEAMYGDLGFKKNVASIHGLPEAAPAAVSFFDLLARTFRISA